MPMVTEQRVLAMTLFAAYVNKSKRAAPLTVSPHVHVDWDNPMGPRLYYRTLAGDLLLFAAQAGKKMFHLERFELTKNFEAYDRHVFNDVIGVYTEIVHRCGKDSYCLWDAGEFESTLSQEQFTAITRGIY